jgi:hypothetical protein
MDADTISHMIMAFCSKSQQSEILDILRELDQNASPLPVTRDEAFK